MNIIYHNIEESDFYVNVGDFQFYFSSEFNKTRFYERYNNYVTSELYKLKSRYNFKDLKVLTTLKMALVFTFYKKIENRGFRVYKLGERIKENG